MKNKFLIFILKHKCISTLAAVITFIFLIPLLINWAYKQSAICNFFFVTWQAEDALNFYGVLLGAFATILAVVLTIKFTQKSQKEERKLSIRPYLQTSYRPIYDFPINNLEGKILYVQVDKLISSEYSEPSMITKLFLKPIEKVKATTNKTERDLIEIDAAKNQLAFLKSNHLLLYKIENSGANNAIDINFTIDNKTFLPPFAISANKALYFLLILSEDLLINKTHDLILSFTYSDVCCIAKYNQTEAITFFRDDTDDTLSTAQKPEQLLSAPKEILQGENGKG